HAGWNLVSLHVMPEDSEPYDPLQMNEILPDDSSNAWFFDQSSRIYRWDNDEIFYSVYPETHTWEWNLSYAYYFWLASAHMWTFDNLPRYIGNAFTIVPDSTWDAALDEWNEIEYWFFLGYSAPSYTKAASIPRVTPLPNGDPNNFDYIGPFHDLIWQGPENNWQRYDLVLVTTDDGRVYIPPPSIPGVEPLDNIGSLEPGRGYFLGFDGSGPYTFPGWADYPAGPTSAPPSQPEIPQIAASVHFQYKKCTQWFYPILIDTIDMVTIPLAPGDEIAIFDDDICVGATSYTGQFPLMIAAWQDDIITPRDKDGYTDGHDITLVWYDLSTNREVTLTQPPSTQTIEDDPIAPRHSGFGRGFYAVRSLVNGIQSVTQLPQEFRIRQNYPNPFNAETVIPLELPQKCQMNMELFNIRGQFVGTVYSGVQNAGYPKIRYNASHLPSGMYFVQVTALGLERGGRFQDISKMLILK
ncbi:MAG: T9SS type A sorting domain-containing protein, partial [bacterium]